MCRAIFFFVFIMVENTNCIFFQIFSKAQGAKVSFFGVCVSISFGVFGFAT